MAKVHAPYNFVPISALVASPEWARQANHDVPFSDGICGTIEVELQAHTPLCVGDREKNGVVHPFMVQGKPAIPGTAIKGMLRNVLEIATFSKMSLVDRDRRYAVRDLSRGGEFYRKQMTRDEGGRVYSSKVKTGWLRKERDKETAKEEWQITPCKMSRVEQKDLLASGLAKNKGQLGSSFHGTKEPAKNKYRAFGPDLRIKFTPEESKAHRMSSGHGRLKFSKAIDIGKGSNKGILVFTGQPSPGKHREFIFYGEQPDKQFRVPKSVKRDFIFNHAASEGERHAGGDPKPNEEWGYWKTKFDNGEPVPVFYLTQSNRIDSMGLAFMYRLAYKNSIGEAIDNSSKDHDPSSAESPADMAELIFGRVREENISFSLRGRANAGLFVSEGNPQILGPIEGVLNGPKPTYYPAYIQQHTNSAGDELTGNSNNMRYQTLMNSNVRLRGWKRYPVRKNETRPPRPGPDQGNVKSSWNAVAGGTKFVGRLHVHNLRPAELGAVLWSLDFGGRRDLHHNLGKAKPFGYGAVSLQVKAHDLWKMDGTKIDDVRDLVGAFDDHMGSQHPNWSRSEQIFQLCAMANPQLAKDKDLSYMTIAPNDFETAKDKHEVLPPYQSWPSDSNTKSEKSLQNEFKNSSVQRRRKAKKQNENRAEKEEKKREQLGLVQCEEPMPDGFDSELWESSDGETRKAVVEIMRFTVKNYKSLAGKYPETAKNDSSGQVAKAYARAFLLVSKDRKWVEEKFGKNVLPPKRIDSSPPPPCASLKKMIKLLAKVDDADKIPAKVLGKKYRCFKALSPEDQKRLANLIEQRCVELGKAKNYTKKWKDVAKARGEK